MNATTYRMKSMTKRLPKWTKILLLLTFLLLFFQTGFTQRVGFTDNFDDGTMTLTFKGNQGSRPPFKIWSTVTPGTYGMVEKDSVLNIEYSREKGIGAFDHFTFTPIRALDVSSNPRVQLQLKSKVETILTVSPVYSLDPPTLEYLQQTVSGDNTWHTYTFNLSPAYNSRFNKILAVDFYFDRDSSVAKSGMIKMDNFKIGWYQIKVTDVKAVVEDGNGIRLNWKSTDTLRTKGYRIYRSNMKGFKADKSKLLAEVKASTYLDKNLEPYRHYFYQIIPVSESGEAFFASEEVNGETYKKGVNPTVIITGANASTVKKYEKFELSLDLKNVGIENPYDPDDIDVYAWINAPSGKRIKVNGFYDDYKGANKWKIRFSPNETGEYNYQAFVKDAGGLGNSSPGKFKAIESGHHGWIKPSTVNPHYFVQDDGTAFYGVGVYSPWGNNQSRFDTYKKNNANLIAVWDIDYGGFTNDVGLIENKLGQYNQKKLGELDSLMVILEKSNIKLMYAIWPHDLFSATVWSSEWKKNPYSQLTDAENVYKDSLVWQYQKKKYRYLIARYAYSRSMGIWELINEMNGTDGWAKGHHQDALDWVEKCDKYFAENDPYRHPVTASFSGGFTEYREDLYKRTEIPNIHLYPAQGWVKKYPLDLMRSDLYNFAFASKRFWDGFDKPAIFGEAGADLTYFKPNDKQYHISYHNQIWASLTNGLSSTPVWWAYDNLNADDWGQLKNLSKFVSDNDYALLPYKTSVMSAEGADAYGLTTGSKAFGWVRSYTKEDISGSKITIKGLDNNQYTILWYNTWKGEYLKDENAVSKDGEMVLTIPEVSGDHPDVAFKINRKIRKE